MIKETKINGKIFVEQRTYYVYENWEAQTMDNPMIITSEKKVFRRQLRREKIKREKQNIYESKFNTYLRKHYPNIVRYLC